MGGDRTILAASLISFGALLMFCGTVRAEFVNGVERFDGTVLDSLNWEAFNNNNGGTIAQDDKLTIQTSANNQQVNYTTRNVAVGVGEQVHVQIMINLIGGFGHLWLTSNSAGTLFTTAFDSYWVEMGFGITSGTTATATVFAGGNGSGISKTNQVSFTNAFQTPHILEFARLSSTSMRCNVYSGGGDLLDSQVATVAEYLSPLYISLTSTNASQTDFDNVAVGAITVPEPGALALPTMVWAAWIGGVRRRQLKRDRGIKRAPPPQRQPSKSALH
jgi:hypothetical protein